MKKITPSHKIIFKNGDEKLLKAAGAGGQGSYLQGDKVKNNRLLTGNNVSKKIRSNTLKVLKEERVL